MILVIHRDEKEFDEQPTKSHDTTFVKYKNVRNPMDLKDRSISI